MALSGLRFDLILLFFVYGLTFFSMGLAMMLESGRAAAMVEARALRPLAAFGLLHGLHEWLEITIYQGQGLGFDIPIELSSLRLGILSLSFTSLIAFGIQVLRPPRGLAAIDAYVGLGVLVFYLSLTAVMAWINCRGGSAGRMAWPDIF